VCVLGEGAKVNLLGFDAAVGKYVKINDVWLQVIGVLARRRRRIRMKSRWGIATTRSSLPEYGDAAVEDNNSYLKDEIDGMYLKVNQGVDSIEESKFVKAILGTTHKGFGRLQRDRPRGPAGAEEADAVHFQGGDDLHCRHFAVGRRHLGS